LLAESFLPQPVAEALAGLLRQAQREHAPVRVGVSAPGWTMLPWEAMPEPVSGRPLALHPLVSVYRRGRAGTPSPLPGPLRIVVAIASPDVDGGPLLDYEHELSSILDAVRGARLGDAQVEVVPFATTEAIRAALDSGGVHVLHVSAHGAPGILHLEDERGGARQVSAEEFLEEAVPAGKMPPVVSLAACYTDAAGEREGASYAARLAEHGACAVIAAQTSVSDRYATRVFARVYAELASSEAPDVVRAVAEARRAIQRDLRNADDPVSQRLAEWDEWSVVTVLAGEPSVQVLDRSKTVVMPPRRAPELGGLRARPVGQFVGRRTAQRDLPAVLESDRFSGVLLHGIGGIGKTTLAAEVLRHTLQRRPLWQVATVTGPVSADGIFAAVAAVLRRDLLRRQVVAGPQVAAVQVATRMDVPWQDRLALLREDVFPGTPVVLVLDNFEDNLTHRDGGWQITDPTLAELLAAWADSPGHSRLLITSRYPFPLPERAAGRLYQYQVPPLSLAETGKLLWSLPHLERHAVDADVREKIWRAVGGHPRCLEYLDALLGAGQGRFPDITRRLTEAVTNRFGPQQATQWLHQERTLDAALAQVATLAADEVLLTEHLDRLATVPGAIRLLAGISVYREPVDRIALLFQIGQPDPTAATPDSRILTFQILSPLADYGMDTDQLDSEQLEQALAQDSPLSDDDRHQLTHLLRQIRQPRPPVAAPPQLSMLLPRLLDTSLVTRLGDRVFMHRWTATELAKHLARYSPPHAESDLLAQAHQAAADYWQWRARNWPQDQVAEIHDWEEARYHLIAIGDFDTADIITRHMCTQLHRWGAWDREAGLIHDTLRWVPPTSGRRATWYRRLGVLAQARGDYGEAERFYRQSLAIDEELGNRAGIANIYHQLGLLAHDRGDHGEAERLYRQALAIAEELGDRSGVSVICHQLGVLAQARGDYGEAERLYRQSLAIDEGLGDRSGVAVSYQQLGRLAQIRGDYGEAERLYQRSLAIKEKLGNRAGMANSYHQLGRLAEIRGDYGAAERLYRKALAIDEELGNRAGIAITYRQLGVLAQARGDYGEAERLYRQSLAIDEESGNRSGVAFSHSRLGVLYAALGRPTEAVSMHCRALDILLALGVPEWELDAQELKNLRALLGDAEFTAAARLALDEGSVDQLKRLLDRFGTDRDAR